MGRRWHIRHADGRRWTFDELLESIRIDRERDGIWPYDAGLFAVAVCEDDCAYLLDNCQTWHFLDAEVVWDD